MPDGVSVFGVFDGHGGKEASIYVREKFVNELVKLDDFKNKQYGAALSKCFRKMDVMMDEPEGRARLRQIQDEHGSADPFGGSS